MAKSVINPYNFVPFGKKVERKSYKEYYDKPDELLNGYIEINIKNTSPLIIPDAEKVSEDNNEHKTYPFFKVKDENGVMRCTIPGSEIRGMIRSTYEAGSNSCVSRIPTDSPISQRTPLYAAFKRRGLLSYDKYNDVWTLYKTRVYRNKVNFDRGLPRVYSEYEDGDLVYYEPQSKSGFNIVKYGNLKGYLQFNTPVNKKGPYNIAILDANVNSGNVVKKWQSGDNSPYNSLKSAIERDGVPNKNLPETKQNIQLRKKLKDIRKNGGMIPVYYECPEMANKGETEVFLSPSACGRIGRNKKWKEIYGQNSPCIDTRELCPACLLFGTTLNGENDVSGNKGRVRFTDALCENEHPRLEKKTLAILGNPSVSAFDFYLNRPGDATFWNFDYYVRSIKVDGKSQNFFFSNDTVTPRGRKFYFNHKPDTEIQADKSNMNSTMEVLDKGNIFKSRIYFDGITRQQLNDLMWSINFGGNSDKYQHNIGHGKPLGYGGLSISIGRCVLRELSVVNETLSYQEKTYTAGNCSFDVTIKNNILAMADVTKTQNQTVDYPYKYDKNGNKQIFKWFADNRRNAKTLVTLPKPTDSNLNLSIEDNRTNNNRSNYPNNRNAGSNFGNRNSSSGNNRGSSYNGNNNRRNDYHGNREGRYDKYKK